MFRYAIRLRPVSVAANAVVLRYTARPKLDELLAFVREGDTVLVHSMDRLARNLDDLRRLVRVLTGKGVQVEFVKENLVFTGEDSPIATLLLSVMGAFAEFERALILERQREGIAAAKQRGVYTGRKPALAPTRPTPCAPAPPPANGSPTWPESSASAARPSTATYGPPTSQPPPAEPTWSRRPPCFARRRLRHIVCARTRLHTSTNAQLSHAHEFGHRHLE